MNYSISTLPIINAFNNQSRCGLCEIYCKIEKNFVDEFLNEAVMEDDCRKQVNKYGFCQKHFLQLFEGQSKLGLALQCHTRLYTIIKNVSKIDNVKQTKKQSETVKNLTKTCVICQKLEYHMKLYTETLVKYYSNDQKFRSVYEKEQGFCLTHYADILEYSKYAGKYANLLVSTTNTIFRNCLTTLSNELRSFCDKFDYRNIQKPMGEEKFALGHTKQTLYGKN